MTTGSTTKTGRRYVMLAVGVLILVLVAWVGSLLWWAASVDAAITPEYLQRVADDRLELSASLQPDGERGNESYIALDELLSNPWADAQDSECRRDFRSLYARPDGGACDDFVLAVMDELESKGAEDLTRDVIQSDSLILLPSELSGFGTLILINYRLATIRRAAHEGNSDALLERIRSSFLLHRRIACIPDGQFWSWATGGDRRLLDDLMRMAMEGMFDEATVRQLLTILTEVRPHDMRPVIESARLSMSELIQRVYSDDGDGRGSLLPHRFEEAQRIHASAQPEEVKKLPTPPRSIVEILQARFTMPSRQDVAARGHELHDDVIAAMTMPLRARYNHVKELCKRFRHNREEGYEVLRMSIPDFSTTIADDYRRDRSIRRARLTLAIEAYRHQHGELPAALTDLAAILDDDVPLTDAFDNTFIYTTSDDGYVLD